MEYNKNIKFIGKDKGFPMDLRPSKIDQAAYELCCEHFGPKVDKILETLHRSPLNFEELMEDFSHYERTHRKRTTDPVYYLALQSVREDLYIKEKLVPWKLEAVPSLPDFPNSKSPGLPYKFQGIKTKREAIEAGAMQDIVADWTKVGYGQHVYFPDVCLFARSQIAKKPKTKIRATWGYPLTLYMEEGRYFYPIQEMIKSQVHNFPIAYGFEMSNGGMSIISDMANRNSGRSYFISDWTKFDKTIPPWLIRDAFDILSELIDFTHVRLPDGSVVPERAAQARKRWNRMVKYFIDTPIRNSKGERFLVSGGVPSGSCFTNLIDSLINAIVTRFSVYHTTGMFPSDEIYLGDDGFTCLSGVVNIKDIAEMALQHFGMLLNVDKSYVTRNPNNIHFLGYFNISGFPFKNLDFLIASFIQPEHPRRTLIEAAAAALGQMLSGYDIVYAVKWYEIICGLADREVKNPFTLNCVKEKLKNEFFRHKYLQHVGITPDSITIPKPDMGVIYKVLPDPSCKFPLKPRRYDLVNLWSGACSHYY